MTTFMTIDRKNVGEHKAGSVSCLAILKEARTEGARCRLDQVCTGHPHTQGIINHPLHGILIHPGCLECPSNSANFKKRFKCVKVVMFGAMILVLAIS